MGRALVRNPRVFLCDEPLSNLDAKLRADMRTEIKRLHAATGKTIVYVTHDQIEAMTLATKIAVLKDGILQQVGSPADIYNKPAKSSGGLHGIAGDEPAEGAGRKRERTNGAEVGPVRHQRDHACARRRRSRMRG